MRALSIILFGALFLGGCETSEALSIAGAVVGALVPLATVIVRLTKTDRDDLWLGKILPFLSVLDPDKGTKLPLTPINPPAK